MRPSADKITAILDSALRLFATQGIQGTPTALIAKEAGVSNGTLFHYFATKEDLVRALYRHLKERMAAEWPQLTPASLGNAHPDVREQFEGVLHATLAWARTNPEAFQFLRMVHHPPFRNLLPADEVANKEAPHLDLLRRGQAQGLVVEAPVELLYAMVFAQVDVLVQLQRETPDATEELYRLGMDRLWALLARS